MKGSLIIVGFFVLGTICGVCHLLPFDIAETNISYYALCALMFSVGLSVGNDPQTLKNFRSLNPRLVFLPIMTILGTLAGSAAVSLILTFYNGLSGRRLGIRLLLALQHLHYRIQGSRAGHHRPACQYQPGDSDTAGRPVAGTMVRKPCPHLCRRSHDDGHHTAHHHTDSRTAVCRSFHLPRVCGRFQRSVPGDIVLLDIGLLPSFDRHRSLTRAIFISLNPINNENQTLYLSPFFAALHRCPGRQRAVAEPASQRNEQRTDARPLHPVYE